MIRRIIGKFQSIKRANIWRTKNRNNTTKCTSNFPVEQVEVGSFTYGTVDTLIFSDDLRLKIGSCCSIAPAVNFLVGADHVMNNISTFPFKVKVLGEKYEAISKGDIIVQDDVWIGYDAVIMAGVTIGDGAIIGTRAVVTKDVEPYSIVGGVPAKEIRKRFSPEVIKKLMEIQWWNWPIEKIRSSIPDIQSGNVDAHRYKTGD